jgi:hypothetical protein
MHQTTVRFSEELWQALEEECARLGVSAAQYLREAALTRIVYAAGKRGDDEFEFALELAIDERPASDSPVAEEMESAVRTSRSAVHAYERAFREGSEAAALAAQGRQARQRARELRERIHGQRTN